MRLEARGLVEADFDKFCLPKANKPAQTQWATPTVFRTKTRKWIATICADYSKLNAVKKWDAYAIPRMEEGTDSLGKLQCSPPRTLTAAGGKLRSKYQISTQQLSISSWTVQTRKNVIWIKWCFRNSPPSDRCRVVSNRMAVCSRIPWRHRRIFAFTTHLLQSCDPGLINHTRCFDYFAARTVHLFCPNVSLLWLCNLSPTSVNSDTHDASHKRLKPSTSTTKLCSRLKLCNFFCSFSPILTRIVAPLSNKLTKHWPKHLGALTVKVLGATHKVEEELVSPPIIALPVAREN